MTTGNMKSQSPGNLEKSQTSIQPGQAKTNSRFGPVKELNNRTEYLPVAPPLIQRKLSIGEPGDVYEREADRIAAHVVSSPEPKIRRSPKLHVNPEQSAVNENGRDVIPSMVQDVLQSPGHPMDAKTRNYMELRFGHDFSRVKVHTDARAAESAQAVNALAYTAGNNVVFGTGQYEPRTTKGKQILAHELQHVVQQGKMSPQNTVQAEFAVEPTRPTPTVATLSAAEITDAVTYNQTRFTDPDEISLLRDILGLSTMPAVIDNEFVQAVVSYQAGYGLTQDGKLGQRTVQQLSREIIAEGTFLGSGNLGSLQPEFRLRDDIQTMIDGGNTRYTDYKSAIQAATPLWRGVALLHTALLTNIRDTLAWNDFARCVELLGRQIPTYWQLIGETAVRTAVRNAWNASNVAVPGPGTNQHEEGGWVFLNLITGELTTRRAAGGGGAAILLTAPPTVTDSVVIAKFHTHPNLGPGWVAGPSDIAPAGPGLPRRGDVTVDATHGVPDIIAGTNGVDPARFEYFPSGPNRRQHLAGNRGLPGAAGGLAPQKKVGRTAFP
jgi:hypothetical protein